MQTVNFIVAGRPLAPGATRSAQAAAADQSEVRGRVKQAASVSTSARAGVDEVKLEAVPGQDVVRLTIEGGPTLTLHPENARDLLRAQTAETRSGTAADEAGGVRVPARLQWRGLEGDGAVRGATRGFLGDILLSAVEIVTDLVTGGVAEAATNFAGSQIVKKVDGQVEPGVYHLEESELPPLKTHGQRVERVPAAPDGGPLLVLVHGTFSNASGAFSKLWTEHPAKVQTLFRHYGKRVYALDHATLGLSPIANALQLARALPANARVHLLTHSRGGLVAEVLARACALPTTDLSPFDDTALADEREEIKELAAIAAEKSLRVDRIVRVACPARGTLLASKRLDAYVSVFKWTLQLAGIPVLPSIVEFLGAVAQLRTDPEQMPGLAAQMPQSALVQWLHSGGGRIPGDLRVIAGDVQGDSIRSWLKTLLADSFYWTDNDLVVQTRSMYGGSPRSSSAQFLLHQAGNVSHSMYFVHERTAEATVNGLTQVTPADFRTIGPLSWAGESSTGVRAARRSGTAGQTNSARPAVFLLPGLLGSNLKVGDDRVWLAWRLINGLDRLKYVLGQTDRVEADGPIGLFYDALAEFLADTHEVVEFGFDWRRPIEDEARRLAAAVGRALDAREKSRTPVRMIAHSMGGIVARTMQLEAPEVWSRMMANSGARLLMLGTPNGGSWAPMQVLSGDDTLGNVISTVGAPFSEYRSRQVIAAFPGLLQLQAALLDSGQQLDTESAWQKIADEDFERAKARSWWHRLTLQLDALKWGVPNQATLNAAAQLRRRLDQQRDRDLAAFQDKLLVVVGQAELTPVGFESGPEGVVYLNVQNGGDGRVPFESAILPGVRAWQADADHGGLPGERQAFAAYLDLLENGTTTRLPQAIAPATRAAAGSAPTLVRTRPSRVVPVVAPPEDEGDVVTGRRRAADTSDRRQPLDVSVTNGDLSFIREPLFLGHYRSSRLTGTEKVMNYLVGGAMAAALDVGLYPDQPGSHQVFLNSRVSPDKPLQPPRPEAVVIVGLGEEGSLRGSDLVRTVRQGVIAWAQRIAEQPRRDGDLEIAATLIGSGGSGISAGQSAQLIAEGVYEANERIAKQRAEGKAWPRVRKLQLIELYLDRASEACRALQMQAEANPGQYRVAEVVREGQGALRRPLDSGYRGADYDFLTAVLTRDLNDDPAISYTIDTHRARTEIRSQATQVRLLQSLVQTASNDAARDERVRRTLFQLLVPVELEPFLGGATEMQIELDRETAGIPWELLDLPPKPSTEPLRPWAIRSRLIRKLRTDQFREQVVDAGPDARVLVIGEPECDPAKYPPLPGARAEARAVVKRLCGPGALASDQVKALIPADNAVGENFQSVLNTLMDGSWRIVHIAGHGEPAELSGPEPKRPGDPPQRVVDPRGVVLSNDTFLGPREIRNLRTVPELVFVNCCHLALKPGGGLVSGPVAAPMNRARFASSVAEELISVGVRCVIAAGWAVEDGPAEAFATTFYDALLRGQRFIDAVAEARDKAHELGGNTWGAYQCYGDPDWIFRRSGADAQAPRRSLVDEFAGISSAPALVLALDTLAVRSKFQHAPKDTQQTKLQHLEARFAQWLDRGDVAEAFGYAWIETGSRPEGIKWLRRAIAANDGQASIRAVEQLANLQTREAVAGLGDTSGKNAGAIDEVVAAIDKDIAMLTSLVAVQSTSERQSLLGAAYKRKALVARRAGRTDDEASANAAALKHYGLGEAQARELKLSNLYYPMMNRMAAELIVHGGEKDWRGLNAADIADVRERLQDLARTDPEFWNLAGVAELPVLLAVGSGNLAEVLPGIEEQYADLHARVRAAREWRSVYDQAQYVLQPYAGRATAAERAAVDKLLGKLAEYAEITPPGAETAGKAEKKAAVDKPARPKKKPRKKPATT